MFFRTYSRLLFSRYSFSKLISSYYHLELLLEVEILGFVQEQLKLAGFEHLEEDALGGRFLFDRVSYQLIINRVDNRNLVVKLIPEFYDAEKCDRWTRSTQGFGAISRIDFEVFRKWKHLFNNDAIVDRVNEYYEELKEYFIDAYSKGYDILFKNLYGILKDHLRAQNKEHLYSTFWLDVTDLKKRRCQNYVDRERLRKVIDQTIEQPSLSYSPFEMVTSFILDDFPEVLTSYSIKSGIPTREYVSNPIPKSFQIENSKIWAVDQILLRGQQCGIFLVVLQKRRYSLQVACSNEVHKELRPVVLAAEPELANEFRSAYRRMKLIPKRRPSWLAKMARKRLSKFLLNDFIGDRIDLVEEVSEMLDSLEF